MSSERKKRERKQERDRKRRERRQRRQNQQQTGNGVAQHQPPAPSQVAAGGGFHGMATTAAWPQLNMEHQFNGDMLASAEDRQLASVEYPEIIHVLDHPALRDEFLRYDKVANTAKLWVHRVGLAAVVLAAVALLGSALTPVFRLNPNTPEKVFDALWGAELGGIVGVIIAAGGIFLAKLKKKWLKARMMSEVLRLWHFQSFIYRGKQIESSCDRGNAKQPAEYQEARDRAFRAFLHEWSGALDSQLIRMVEHPQGGYQMLHDEPTKLAPDSPVLEKIFKAYRSMRFRHQDNYATHKLDKWTDKPLRILKWPAALLQERMQGLASFCLLGSLVCSLIIVIGHLFHIRFANSISLPVAIIGLLILNVAARAVQDGLAAPEELQRYNDYAGRVHYLLERFDASSNPAEKLELMSEMERAALEELKGFLRAHSEARFVL
jgi:hypothetical protein